MADNAKLYEVAQNDFLKIVKIPVDFSVENGAIGVYSLNGALPTGHSIVNVDVYTNTALASGGSATISIGTDDITTEPDNLLNDEAVASFGTAGLLVAGIPRLGTAATKVEVGTATTVAYEIKTASITSGKFTIVVTLLPTA